jgi:chromosome segregation ATPase
MKVSITKAAELSGVSRTTLYTDMNSGKLTYHSEGKNKKTIDIAELERVYGQLNTPKEEKVQSSVKSEQKDLTTDSAPLTELAVLREKLSMLETHTKDIKDQYESRIESLEKSLEKAQDGYNSMTKLLEDKSNKENKEDKWQSSIQALESRIANQETKAEEEKERAQKILRQNQALKKQLEEEKNKSFWAKLFG